MKRRVLVLCTGNSARSQMAEGLIRNDFGDRVDVVSAGTHPTSVRTEAVRVMRELGIDISSHRSKHVDRFRAHSFDDVLSVCDDANERCPVFPGKARRAHRGFEDPARVSGTEEERLTAFRRVRDEMRIWIAELFEGPAKAALR